ncbi:hypothetical protein ACSLVQ_27420, partial [Klebsiella pneumoniae]|uniref:hypothetical protein n=1 Tax=Klebsiella pneumoniae TaxID=573 RepID=UPI003EE371C7
RPTDASPPVDRPAGFSFGIFCDLVLLAERILRQANPKRRSRAMMIWRGTGTSGLVALLRLYADRDRNQAPAESRPPAAPRPEPKAGRREG